MYIKYYLCCSCTLACGVFYWSVVAVTAAEFVCAATLLHPKYSFHLVIHCLLFLRSFCAFFHDGPWDLGGGGNINAPFRNEHPAVPYVMNLINHGSLCQSPSTKEERFSDYCWEIHYSVWPMGGCPVGVLGRVPWKKVFPGRVSHRRVAHGRVAYGRVPWGRVSPGRVFWGRVFWGCSPVKPGKSLTWHWCPQLPVRILFLHREVSKLF